jgi:hypothetical protein
MDEAALWGARGRVDGMLNQLAGKIADLWNAPDQWIEAELKEAMPDEAVVELAPGDHFRLRFIDLARDRQRQNGQLVSSLLTIVWQGSKLTALGAQYRDLRKLAGMVTEVVLEQMAAQPDFFLRYDDDNVVLCFASPNRMVIELRTAMMAQALRAALLQRIPDLAGKVRIDFTVTAVEPVEAVRKGRDLAAGLVDLLCRARDLSVVGHAATA